jgi:hypothetical protein
LIVSGKDAGPFASMVAELVKEDGAWKLTTCNYSVPSLQDPIDFQ